MIHLPVDLLLFWTIFLKYFVWTISEQQRRCAQVFAQNLAALTSDGAGSPLNLYVSEFLGIQNIINCCNLSFENPVFFQTPTINLEDDEKSWNLKKKAFFFFFKI